MATIEKEKALDVVRQMVADGQVSQEVAEKYFPELAESEDKRIRKAIKYGIVHVFTNNTTVFEVTKEQCLAWLEKQGEKGTKSNERKIPNSNWSEEDESRIDNLCHFLEEYGNQYYGHLTLQGTISWLKSIKERYTWKPSDEQLKALDFYIRTYVDTESCYGSEVLELYEQLKELIED